MRFLSHKFEWVDLPSSWRPWLLRNLRMDICAKSAWYYGRCGRMRSLRMLLSDGSLCSVLYRLTGALRGLHLWPLAAVVYKLNTLLTGAVIGLGAEFGPGLVILHSHGTVINKAVRGGANVTLENGITLGAEKGASPKLGDNVFVGAGARVIGGVRVGSRARIGANGVVLEDVPEDATAVGVPARVVARRSPEV